MRQKVKRRWFACLWTIFLVFLFWWFISVARRNAQAAYSATQQNRGAGTVQLKVVVVEEHQEALVVWSDAVARNVMRPNSTLVYIDAHSNDRSPSLPTKAPNFRVPKTEEEVDQLFQGNGFFVAAAQMSQMLQRVVWIHPFWKTEEELYRSKRLNVGRAMYEGQDYVCECEKAREAPEFCNIEVNGRVAQVPYRQCALHHTVKREAIRDVYARTRLPVEKSWLSGNNVVLAIDEDFFGVRSPARQLLDSDMSWSDVTGVSKAVQQLICPKLPSHERMADRWFYGLVDAMRTKCLSDKDRKPWCSDGEAATRKFFHSFKSDLTFSKIFCSRAGKEGYQPAFVELWAILRRLTANQLLELQHVGVCLAQSMRTAATPPFQLCIGRNTPNDSAVSEHYPSAAELSQQYARLQAILSAMPSRPRLITLARSSRDGHVPRDLQADIEHNVLQILREVYKVKETDIIFDKFLLNGRQADWYHRTYYVT